MAAVKASGEAEKRAPQPVYTEQECSPFECNICLDLAKEPVVTFCGHLFCWPCLYRWMEVNSHYQTCPVCKSGLDANKVVPIYGRGNDATDPRVEMKDSPDSVPSRPAGRRAVPILRAPMVMSQENVNGNQGVIPMLFGFSQGGNTPASEVFSSEQQQQAFLSRLLLMLGSFVIMCLLLF